MLFRSVLFALACSVSSTYAACWARPNADTKFMVAAGMSFEQNMGLKRLQNRTYCDRTDRIDVYVAKDGAKNALMCVRTEESQKTFCGTTGACCTIAVLRETDENSPAEPTPVFLANNTGIFSSSQAISGFANPIFGIQNPSSCGNIADYNVVLPVTGLASIGPVSFKPPQCGQCIEVQGPNGKSITAIISSTFQGTTNDLQLSVSHYNEIATDANGQVIQNAAVSWKFVPCPLIA